MLYKSEPFKESSSWSLLTTTDGGASWRQMNFRPTVRLEEQTLKLQFVDDQHGWLLTHSGMMYTVDGGLNWTWH